MRRIGAAVAAIIATQLVATNAAFSGASAATPSAGKIAFISAGDLGQEIFVANADGSNRIAIVSDRPTSETHSAGYYDPELSADGTKIAYASDEFTGTTCGCNREIFVANSDGTNPVNISNEVTLNSHPSWSPDGSAVAFEGAGGIVITAPDGTGRRVVPNTSWASMPSWSPQGTQLVFGVHRDSDMGLRVINADGTGLRSITNYGTRTTSDRFPDWSPDGSRVTFTSDRDGDDELFVVNVDGTALTQITHNDYLADAKPAWSPDGSRIAFESNRDDGQDIFAVNPDGSEVVSITGTLQPIDEWDVTWSSGSVAAPMPTCRGLAPTIVGTTAADVIAGTPANDVIFAGDGNDSVDGKGGNDIVCGGKGNDHLTGGPGNDQLQGDDGNDSLDGGTGGDTLVGLLGTDTATYANSPAGVQVTVGSGTGNDGSAHDGQEGHRDTVASDVENVVGSRYADVIKGNAAANVLSGAGGNDTVTGGRGRDTLRGGSGSDRLVANDTQADALIDNGSGADHAPKYDRGVDPRPVN